MTTPALKLNVFVGFPSYGGNGGIDAEHPSIREWWVETVLKMKADPRIGEIVTKTIGDTPVTHVRNRFVRLAREAGCHLLLMVDSDQKPDLHKNDPWYKPFWDVAFDEIYNHYQRGPLCLFAPYCGPPGGGENVYVFQWGNDGLRGDETPVHLDQYTREQAAQMSGVQEAAAGPTGMMLTDLRCFDLVEPSGLSKRAVLERFREGKLTIDEAEHALHEGYFYYEWKDAYADEKASTEDVTFTRDLSLAGMAVLGYNPLRCCWDSWIGHHKPYCVGKPQPYTVEQLASNFRRAVEHGRSIRDKLVDAKNVCKLPPALQARMNGTPVVVQQPSALNWKTAHKTPQQHLDALAEFVRSYFYGRGKHPNVIEVGSWLGDSAIAMHDAGARTVDCVDTWEGSPGDPSEKWVEAAGGGNNVFAEFLARVKGRRIEPCRAASTNAATIAWHPAEIIYLDADHRYEAVKADILAWWKHLKPDGYLLGHDYGVDQFPGVTQAVHELFGDKVELLGQCEQGAIWCVKKSDFPNFLQTEAHAHGNGQPAATPA